MTESSSRGTQRLGWSAAYQVGWSVAAGSVLALGLVAALVWPVTVPPYGVFLCASVLAVTLSLPFAEHPAERPGRWVQLGLGAGSAAVVVEGLAAWWGWWSLLPLVLLALTSPWLVGALVRVPAPRRSGRDPGPASATPQHAGGDDPWLARLDVEQLCRRWQDSFERLMDADTPERIEAVVRERDELLAELTRRDPDGMAAWLAEGPRPTADPRRHLRPTQDG